MSAISSRLNTSGSYLNRVRRRLVTSFGIRQTMAVDRLGSFRFHCANQVELFRTQDYGGELLPLAAFLFLLRADDVVWDVGASIGLLTVHSAALARQVIAFEPDPATNRRLQENVRLNGLSDKVRFEGCALGDQAGEFELHTDGLNGSAPTLKALGRHSRAVRVPVKTIDQIIAAGTTAPSVLKIDIEGAEIVALRGAHDLLHSSKAPRLLFLELHPEFLKSYAATPEDVMAIVKSAGYQVLSMRPEHEQYHLVATR